MYVYAYVDLSAVYVRGVDMNEVHWGVQVHKHPERYVCMYV